MSGIGVSPIVLLSLLLLAIGGGHATFINFPRPVTVTGQLCCTQNGNCPGAPVAGATVTLTCPGTLFSPPVSVSTTTTAAGAFTLSTTVNSNSITGLTVFVGCTVTVPLPVPAAAACPVLSNSGGRLVSPVIRTGQVGGVQTGVPIVFVRL